MTKFEEYYKCTKVENGWFTQCRFCNFSMSPEKFNSIKAIDHVNYHESKKSGPIV